jgi:uncharacterized protein YdhG (YjbR/CyaY superfamily)
VRDLAVLFLHLLVTVARLAAPSGARSVVAESVLVKHQLLILNRSRKRSPNLRPSDRVVAGLCAVFIRPDLSSDHDLLYRFHQGYQQCFAAHGGQPIERQSAPTDIDEYTAGFPPHVQKRPKKLRATIMKAALEAQETIKYRMPTFTLHGNVIHFAAYKHHIGLHPAPNGTQKFKKELCLRMRARRAPQGFRWTSPFLSTWSAGFVKSRV